MNSGSLKGRTILSGTRPTSPKLHIGNYEGALRRWVELQDQGCKVFSMVADIHVYTTKVDAAEVGRNSLEVAKDYVAAGLDPDRTSIFIQSQVQEHAELATLLGMVVGVGKLERNPTFKDMTKDVGGQEMVSFGLLGYPVLQTSDILLYKPYGVPVGKDQAPHLEIGREIARAFNTRFGEVFPEYVSIINEDERVAKLPGLDADEEGKLRKMSKSYGNCIYLNESPDETAEKIKKAFTTPSKMRKTDPGVPEGCAVCQYLRVYSPNWEAQWKEDVEGVRGCMQNKKELIEALNEALRPIREKRAGISDADIRDILAKGRKEAQETARATVAEVKKAMGMLPI
jgi:tryptophanyl-tRNA synthetase